MCSTIVAASDRPKTFLPSSVPLYIQRKAEGLSNLLTEQWFKAVDTDSRTA